VAGGLELVQVNWFALEELSQRQLGTVVLTPDAKKGFRGKVCATKLVREEGVLRKKKALTGICKQD